MELETVLYRVEGNVAVISLNRTKAMNSLNKQIFADLTTAFEAARDDAAVRCVVMNGEGRAFCAGGDIAEMKSITTEEAFFDFMTVAGGFTTLAVEGGVQHDLMAAATDRASTLMADDAFDELTARWGASEDQAAKLVEAKSAAQSNAMRLTFGALGCVVPQFADHAQPRGDRRSQEPRKDPGNRAGREHYPLLAPRKRGGRTLRESRERRGTLPHGPT